jgi:hypothetical protein
MKTAIIMGILLATVSAALAGPWGGTCRTVCATNYVTGAQECREVCN